MVNTIMLNNHIFKDSFFCNFVWSCLLALYWFGQNCSNSFWFCMLQSLVSFRYKNQQTKHCDKHHKSGKVKSEMKDAILKAHKMIEILKIMIISIICLGIRFLVNMLLTSIEYDWFCYKAESMTSGQSD
jgi:hypothetical protein